MNFTLLIFIQFINNIYHICYYIINKNINLIYNNINLVYNKEVISELALDEKLLIF